MTKTQPGGFQPHLDVDFAPGWRATAYAIPDAAGRSSVHAEIQATQHRKGVVFAVAKTAQTGDFSKKIAATCAEVATQAMAETINAEPLGPTPETLRYAIERASAAANNAWRAAAARYQVPDSAAACDYFVGLHHIAGGDAFIGGMHHGYAGYFIGAGDTKEIKVYSPTGTHAHQGTWLAYASQHDNLKWLICQTPSHALAPEDLAKELSSMDEHDDLDIQFLRKLEQQGASTLAGGAAAVAIQFRKST